MIKNSNGKFKVAFSISGVALEQLEIYVPGVYRFDERVGAYRLRGVSLRDLCPFAGFAA